MRNIAELQPLSDCVAQMFVVCSGLAALGNDDLKGSHLKSKDISPEQVTRLTHDQKIL